MREGYNSAKLSIARASFWRGDYRIDERISGCILTIAQAKAWPRDYRTDARVGGAADRTDRRTDGRTHGRTKSSEQRQSRRRANPTVPIAKSDFYGHFGGRRLSGNSLGPDVPQFDYFGEVWMFGRRWHILHEKLVHIDLLSALYDPKRVLVNTGVLVSKGVWLTKGS